MNKLLILVFVFLLGSTIYAQDLKIEGNGDNSKNSININVSTTKSVQQENTATINTTVDCTASTGDNQANGNNGNTTIVTGDSNCITTINNVANNNAVTPTEKSTITPTAKPQATATPLPNGNNPTQPPDPSTPKDDSNRSNDNGGNNENNGNTGLNGNTGEVMGLAATSGESPLNAFWSVAGVVCLALGSLILKQQQNS